MNWLWYLLVPYTIIFSCCLMFVFDFAFRRLGRTFLGYTFAGLEIPFPMLLIVCSCIIAAIMTDPVFVEHSIYDQMAIKLFWSM